MGTFIAILILTTAVAGLVKKLSERSVSLKRWSWHLGVLIEATGVLIAILGFWPSDKPATPSDVSSIISEKVDSLQTDIFVKLDSDHEEVTCRMDRLEALIKKTAGQPEPDSSFLAEARSQAECLEGIVETALDKGIVAIGLQKYDEALTLLDIALKAAGENLIQRAKVLFYIGLIHSKRGEYILAFELYDSCITDDPRKYGAWNNRGSALSRLNRFDEALNSYDSALAYKPDFQDAWYNRGIALSELGFHKEGIASYDSALVYKPNYHEAWYNRGNALDNLNLYEESIASYDSALVYKPDGHKAWHNRGNALHKLGLHRESIASYDSALVYKPDDNEAWSNRGIALGRLNRFDEALNSYDSALAYKPDFQDAWYNRGIALSELGFHKEEIASYDSALVYKPDNHNAWYNRGIALGVLNRFDEALNSCDSAQKYSMDKSEVIVLRQWILDLMND